MISFCQSADEVFALLGCYKVTVGGYLLTFQDSLLVPSSRVKQSATNMCCIKTQNSKSLNTLFHMLKLNIWSRPENG